MKYRILTIDNEEDLKILRKKSKRVEIFDYDLRVLIEDMKDIAHKQDGWGLSAVQIGIPHRVLVFSTDGKGRFATMVNPVIRKRGVMKTQMEEGCLSIPNKSVRVSRDSTIMVSCSDAKETQRPIPEDRRVVR